MTDETPGTCGEGLAAQAHLPDTVGALMAAMADVLAVHQQTLDLSDENARPEHHAYGELVQDLRRAAHELNAIAERMTGYRGLPMGRHDEARLSGRESRDAFARYVAVEEALHARLEHSIPRWRQMLEGWRV